MLSFSCKISIYTFFHTHQVLVKLEAVLEQAMVNVIAWVARSTFLSETGKQVMNLQNYIDSPSNSDFQVNLHPKT